jgi:membrane associated rhomboid family serine protease
LLILSLSFSKKLTIIAYAIISLLGGGLVWLFGRSDTVHIGASGIIFGLMAFLMFSGIFRRELKTRFLSLVVFFLYGGARYALIVFEPGISWTGHFFGLLAGTLAAWWTKTEQKNQRKGPCKHPR